ncbi:MAG: PDZ domain-containing protein [Acidobacteriota bacterium]|nr:PDZ domain-containing protein [Acidobacteriota bacterium]
MLSVTGIAVVPINTLAQISVSNSSQQATQSSNTSGNASTRKSAGGSLGVYLGDINEERAKELKLTEARGAVVGNVEEGSPAAAAGLRENDVILTFNNQRIYNPGQLYRFLTESSPGGKVILGVSRNGNSQNIAVTLGPRRAAQMDERERLYAGANAFMDSSEESAKRAEEAKQRGDEKEATRLLEESNAFRKNSEENRAAVDRELAEGKVQFSALRRLNYSITAARYQLGVRVTELTPQLAKFFNTSGGVLVNEVVAGEAAERSGIKAGDCITAVNAERVNTPSDLNRLVDRTGKDEKEVGEITLTIVRDRAEQTIKVRFGQR